MYFQFVVHMNVNYSMNVIKSDMKSNTMELKNRMNREKLAFHGISHNQPPKRKESIETNGKQNMTFSVPSGLNRFYNFDNFIILKLNFVVNKRWLKHFPSERAQSPSLGICPIPFTNIKWCYSRLIMTTMLLDFTAASKIETESSTR